ncbi:hypothetical protein GX50_04280 [[Emmonsia] crescens]|uniref:Uncharacterized protein n=1 Tax=[Emmonsia] crescens TaxID=73230 RepID=A0A2B7ZG24_9EURO|nr:hypothetical protein GX50_04280 [Emmonsia crescens]
MRQLKQPGFVRVPWRLSLGLQVAKTIHNREIQPLLSPINVNTKQHPQLSCEGALVAKYNAQAWWIEESRNQWKTTQLVPIRWTPKHQELYDGLIQQIMPLLVKGRMLEVLPSHSFSNSPTSWKTTSGSGVSIFSSIYTDFRTAINQYNVLESALAEAGLQQSVQLISATLNKHGHLQAKVLKNTEYNPFNTTNATSTGIKRAGIGEHCIGLLQKSLHDPGGISGGVALRALGLARACGISELDLFDFLEIIANASVYK